MSTKKIIKRLCIYSLIAFTAGSFFSCKTSHSPQDSMVGQHRESTVWTRWKMKRERKNDLPYNPVLHSKTKPSTLEARENKKVVRKAKKAVRKEKRRLRRTKGAYQKPK